MLAAATTSSPDCGVRNLGATIFGNIRGPVPVRRSLDVARLRLICDGSKLLSLKCHVAAAGNLGSGRTVLQDWLRGDKDNESRRATNRIQGRQRATASGGGQSV